MSLLSGASLVIPHQSRHLIGTELEGFIAKECITHLIITPSVLETANPDNVPTGISIVLVGESLPERTVERWGKKRVLYNAYGPSEASICATVSGRLAPGELVPVGKPLPGVRIEIVDKGRKTLPVGELGEVAIGGVGVSAGYLDDAAATAEGFVRLAPGGELFHLTGDIGYIGNQGNLFLHGRKDQQVKINGRRIDLGEIERALCKHDSVLQACASKIDREGSGHRLAVFIRFDSSQEMPNVQQLREFIATLLPSFALPSAWYVVESLPTTVNGKLNRKMLSESVSYELYRGDYVPPEGDLEKIISSIFEDILKVDNIGRHDNFFVLGGSSLDTIRVVDRLHRNFSADINYESFIGNPTVREVADLVCRGTLPDNKKAPFTSIQLSTTSYRTFEASVHFPEVILITGGTGFLGKCMVEKLLISTRAHIICATRHRSQSQFVDRLLEYPGLAEHWDSQWAKRVSSIYYDLEETESHQITPVIGNVDLVIHCAANVNLAYDFGSLYRANVLATLNLVDYCSTGRPKKFLFVSSRSVVDSNDASGYGKTKREAERIAQEAFARGLVGTIVRPGRITGHGTYRYINHSDFIIRCIKACLVLGLYPAGLEVFGGVPVNLLAADIVKACWHADSENRVINIPDSEFYRFSEIFNLTEAAGYPVHRVPISRWLEKASDPNFITRFPEVLGGFEKNWDEIRYSCSMENYCFPEGNSFVRAERTRHLVASILSGPLGF